MVPIFLENDLELTLTNVVYTPEYYFNLIALSQLQITGILYHNGPKYIVLKWRKKTIELSIKKKNLFIVKTQIPGKIILVKSRRRLTYLFSKNLQIRLWYKRIGYASNTRVVGASKLTNRIDITIEDGHQMPEKQLFSNFKEDKKDKNAEFLTTTTLLKITSISRNNSNNLEETYFK